MAKRHYAYLHQNRHGTFTFRWRPPTDLACCFAQRAFDGAKEKLDYDTTIPSDVIEADRIVAEANRAYIERMNAASAVAAEHGNLDNSEEPPRRRAPASGRGPMIQEAFATFCTEKRAEGFLWGGSHRVDDVWVVREGDQQPGPGVPSLWPPIGPPEEPAQGATIAARYLQRWASAS
jgi:hypothetical protein